MPDITPEEQKALMQAAIEKAAREWLQEQYTLVGRWTVRGIAAAALVALIVFLGHNGYRLEQFITPQ